MTDSNTLNERLSDIQKSVIETDIVYKSYQQRTRGDLVSAYLWWKDAVQDIGYLEALLEENEIEDKQKANSNSVNFKPIVQLVFEKYDLTEGNNRNEVYTKQKAMDAIHAYYEEKVEFLKRRDNVHNELLNWINDNGGLSGITKKYSQNIEFSGNDAEDDESNFNYSTSQPNKSNPSQPSPKAQQKKQKQKLGTVAVQRKQAVAHKTDTTVDVGEVATDEDELVVMLARRNADGTVSFIGNSTDEGIVNRALELCTSLDLTSKNKILRIIVESLQPHYVPTTMHDKKLRSKFFTKSTTKFQYENSDKAERVTENVRLVLTQDNTVVVSKNPTTTSLLTVAQSKFDMGIEWDLFLRANDRNYLEIEGEHNKSLATVDSDEEEELSDTPSHIKADKQLTLLNSFTQTARNIYFYDYELLDYKKFVQPTCNEDIESCYVWKATVTQSHIKKLNNQHFKQWIAKTNKRIVIKENKHFEFVVDKDALEVCSYFNFNEEEYTNSGEDYTTYWEKPSDITLKKKSATHFHRVCSLDVVQVFETVSNIQTNSDITLYGYEGDEYGGCIAIRYETEVATYTTYIPHCNIKGRREDCDLFTNFEAT